MHNNLLNVNFLTYRIITSKYTSKIAYNIIYLIKSKKLHFLTQKSSVEFLEVSASRCELFIPALYLKHANEDKLVLSYFQ